MPGFRIGTTERPLRVTALASTALASTALASLVFFVATAGAFAQTARLDEIVNSDGAVSQQLMLTEAQKSAIYNAVLRQRVHGKPAMLSAVPPSVGAPVSPAAELAALPDQAAVLISVDNTLALDLKYATVEDDVVV